MSKTKGKERSTKKKEKERKETEKQTPMRDYREAPLPDMKAIGKFCLCSRVILQAGYSNGERIFVQKPRCARILVSPTAISYTISGSTVTVIQIS